MNEGKVWTDIIGSSNGWWHPDIVERGDYLIETGYDVNSKK